MTVKQMSGKQVIFLQKLIKEKVVAPEEWLQILKELEVEKEDDLYHLNVEQASGLIFKMINMPDK